MECIHFVRMLENRLDKAEVKYNEALGHNKKLRETIDNLRRERAVFDGIHARHQQELATKKEKMSKILDSAMKSYEDRVHAQIDMVKLKEEGDRETKQFEREWKELNRLIEENSKRSQIGETRRNTTFEGGDLDNEHATEKDLRKRLNKSTMQVATDKIAIQRAEEEVAYYREAFQKIQQATGITNIDELAKNFEDADKENFKLFNEANTLNKEIERLEAQISEMKKEIEKAKGSGNSADTQRKRILQDLQSKLETTQTKTLQYDKKHKVAMETVNSLKNGVRDVLLCMDAQRVDPEVMERIESVGINESNLMDFLAIIEKRTNDLIQVSEVY